MGTTYSLATSEIKKLTKIKFHIQDKEHTIRSEDVDPSTSLNYYLRNILHLTGTKGMCYEGGCGSCVVVLQIKDPITQNDSFLAVNSCLIPLMSCNGLRIFTIEGIGNPKEGYHNLQKILAKFNGTQCGFCSPGMVMNMYALYESGKLTMQEVEDSFSGNICRCTGYRSILASFKSLCKDASTELLGEVPDIEDFVMCDKEKCRRECNEVQPFYVEFASSKWIKVHNLTQLLKTLKSDVTLSYKLVGGNTAQGVYPSYKHKVDLYIDVNDVVELKQKEASSKSCVLGANVTLSDTIEFFESTAKKYSQFSYLKAVADHIALVANVPVRNRGTLAGNLIIKHDHHEFPSDIFLTLETVNAKLTIVDLNERETQVSPAQFLIQNMQHMVLKSVTLPPYADSFRYVSYKIMPRAQNTHAHVNSGFLFEFKSTNVIKSARIVYGNINRAFVHASRSERFLQNKNLFDNGTLKEMYKSLASEIEPAIIPPDPSPKFRKGLAIALFYKAVLSIAPSDKLTSRNKSGGPILYRPISNGVQVFGTNKSMYPVTKPVPKLEALAQTSGQAQYIMDMPDLPHQLYGALVLAKAPAKSTIIKIDSKSALASKGIVAFYTKNDIPGDNVYNTITPDVFFSEEELFCTGVVKYYNQPIGILVGETQEDVDHAVDLVEVKYNSPNTEPLLSIRQILKEGRTDRIDEYKTVPAKSKGKDVKRVLKGTFDVYNQYHFHMETQCCNVVPHEDGLDVYPSTQWMDMVQVGIARVLKIEQNKINIVVRRCGGAFGAKISKATLPACATALASWLLQRPVKLWLPLSTNMRSIGKRYPFSADYEVGVDDKGAIQYLTLQNYTDVGYQFDEDTSRHLEAILKGTYASDRFTLHYHRVITDTPTNTWTRGPGSTEGAGTLESIMEHIAYSLNLDPIDVRVANFAQDSPLNKYVDDLKSWAEIDKRRTEISNFNQENRWKKRGLAVAFLHFEVSNLGPHIAVVSIFHKDGSVQVTHGGVEIGQGINTKAAQVCAYKLGLDLDKIKILPSNTFSTPNNFLTGISIASDGACYAIAQACDVLLERIKPYRSKDSSWEDTIKKCHENSVELTASGVYTDSSPNIKPYTVYGVCATEVIVDILTGQHVVSRVDIIEDTGDSMSPIVDIGQVEGAFIMGLGYYTTEKIVYNYEGNILTYNTWTYLPPGAKDIPVHFNVKFPEGNPNPVGVMKSKTTGEPAMVFGVSVPIAIRNALASARTDAASSNDKWYPIDGTTDLENVFLNSGNDPSQYVL